MKSNTDHSKLHVFFFTMLGELYWSEKHLGNVLLTMKETASTPALGKLFDRHMTQTQEHLKRLEQIYQSLGKPINEKFCVGMQGLFDEGWQVIDETDKGSFQRDVALVIAAQKVEHYEIASYGSLFNLAKTLDFTDVAAILAQTLNEEKETDLKLSQLAEQQLNKSASKETAPPKKQTRKISTKTEAPMKEERESNFDSQAEKLPKKTKSSSSTKENNTKEKKTGPANKKPTGASKSTNASKGKASS